MAGEPDFTFGIEEEYLLIDPVSLNLASEPHQGVFDQAEAAAQSLPGSVSREMIRAQIEIGTGVCHTGTEAAFQLKQLRRIVIDAAHAHDLGLLACSTHPFAYAEDQRRTDRRRYRDIKTDLQFAARRLMVCGMHVHIGIPDKEQRIYILNGIREYLPVLLALTASSPFWEGGDTGLKSVRPVILDELPRAGLPDRFANYAAYERTVQSLVHTGVIEDASKIWWDARLSSKFPTLEIRMMDVCPRVDDSLALASLCRCVCRMLWRRQQTGEKPVLSPRLVVMENRWRAQKFGAEATLIDHRQTALRPLADLVHDMTNDTADDASHFQCEPALARILEIAKNGTSADRQRAIFQSSEATTGDPLAGLRAVVSAIEQETQSDLVL